MTISLSFPSTKSLSDIAARAYLEIMRIKKVTNAIAITTRCSHCLLVDVRVGESHKVKVQNSLQAHDLRKCFSICAFVVNVNVQQFISNAAWKTA
jgi:hypothetical protein